jgi:general secretion pathway protein D
MRRFRVWTMAGLVLTLGACAGQQAHRSGMQLVASGDVEQGLAKLAEALKARPDDVAFRQDYYTTQFTALSELHVAAQKHIALGNTVAAETAFRQMLRLDPTNAQAGDGLQRLRRNQRFDETLAAARRAVQAGDGARGLPAVNAVLAEDANYQAARALKREIEEPLVRSSFQEIYLKDAYAKPINLEFREANVRQLLEALSRTSGINFILDKDIPLDLKTTVLLRNAYIDEAVDLILRNSQLRRKILNSTTVQIYPDTGEKRKEYQELVVRAFYLQDATATQIQTVFKTLLRMKDIVIDERLNLVTVRDTPEAVRLAEKLVALHDLAEPEVMLEVEVLEIQRDDLLKFGIQWPNQLTLVPMAANGGSLTLDDLHHLSAKRLGTAFSNPIVNLRQDHGVTNLLANPRIRVHNREKASILIGDKLPVITTTSTSTGFVAENVQYLDVGLKLSAEPVIHPSNEVSLRLNLEVSTIAGQVSTANGTLAYQVGTRNAATFLRLQDGETQVLAGLISDQDRQSSSGVPGLSRLPLLGRLFSSPSDSRSKTEIVLSITPRVVRNAARPDAQAVEFWSGTENGLATQPMRLNNDRAAPAPLPAGAVLALGATAAAAPAQTPPQFIWAGPNQVRVGEEFTLSLRVKAGDGRPVAPMQIVYDGAALEVSALVEGELAREAGDAAHRAVALDGAGKRVDVDLSRLKSGADGVDGNVLALRLRALVAGGATELKLVASGAGQGQPGFPHKLTVTP